MSSYGFFGFLQLLLIASAVVPVVMFVRYFVWRGRYDRISRVLEAQNQTMFVMRGRIEALERGASARMSAVAAASSAVAPVADQAAAPVEQAAAAVKPEAEISEPAAVAYDSDGPPTAVHEAPSPSPGRAWASAQPAPIPERKVWATSFNDRRPSPASEPASSPFPPQQPGPIAGAFARWRSNPDLEAVIGTSWLNKIGVAVLVIGVALLSGYSLRYMGPEGKIALGAGIGAVLLAIGVWLERRRRYTLFARPLIGGGWAMLYFTAYAAHAIEASRIIFDPVLGLFALVLVAVGMIGHSLRYRSEIVTGFAYLLGFLAILISPVTTLSLVPVGLLAASFAVIFRFIPWYRLSAGMVIATYAAIWFWMTQMPPPSEFGWDAYWPIQLILAFYWVVFFAVDYLRVPDAAEQTGLQRFTIAFNSVAFAVLSWVIVRTAFPALDSYVILTTAAVAALVVALFAVWRGRSFSHQFHVLLSGVGAAIAIPSAALALDWPSGSVQIGWTLLAGMLLASGFYRRVLSFRIEGYVVAVLATLGTFVLVFRPVFDAFGIGLSGEATWLRLVAIVFVAVALYAAEFALKHLGEWARPAERQIAPIPGYAGTALLAALAFQDVAAAWLGLVWLAGGLVAVELGLRVRDVHWRNRGYLLLSAAFAALMLNNIGLYWLADPALPPQRWMILSAAALGYLAVAMRLRMAGDDLPATERAYYPLFAHASAVLVVLVAWIELPVAAVGLAWGLIALAYREAGVRLKETSFRIEAYVLILIAWMRLFVVDLVTVGDVAGLATRVLATLPIAAVLLYFRHGLDTDAANQPAGETRLRPLLSGAAIVAVVALGWLEFGANGVAVGWAGLSLLLLVAGIRFGHWDYRSGAYAVALGALVVAITTNVHLTGNWNGFPESVTTTSPVVATLLAIGLLRRPQHGEGVPTTVRWLDRWSMPAGSVLAVLLTAALLYRTVDSDALTIGWAVEALIVIGLGFLLKERALRLSGLALLALCLGKGLVYDLQDADAILRIISVIVLGAILVGVSFVYTRYRHVLRTII